MRLRDRLVFTLRPDLEEPNRIIGDLTRKLLAAYATNATRGLDIEELTAERDTYARRLTLLDEAARATNVAEAEGDDAPGCGPGESGCESHRSPDVQAHEEVHAFLNLRPAAWEPRSQAERQEALDDIFRGAPDVYRPDPVMERLDRQRWGDQMQSEASRLAEAWLDPPASQYEADQAAHGIRSLVEAWTRDRRLDTVAGGVVGSTSGSGPGGLGSSPSLPAPQDIEDLLPDTTRGCSDHHGCGPEWPLDGGSEPDRDEGARMINAIRGRTTSNATYVGDELAGGYVMGVGPEGVDVKLPAGSILTVPWEAVSAYGHR